MFCAVVMGGFRSGLMLSLVVLEDWCTRCPDGSFTVVLAFSRGSVHNTGIQIRYKITILNWHHQLAKTDLVINTALPTCTLLYLIWQTQTFYVLKVFCLLTSWVPTEPFIKRNAQQLAIACCHAEVTLPVLQLRGCRLWIGRRAATEGREGVQCQELDGS